MKSCILEARTVALVRDLKVEKKQGANGEFESKDILFRIAVNRDYKVTRQENGKTISEYPTDFWLAKAVGPIAQILKDNCCKIKEDGKLHSRHLLLSGSFENYTNTRKVQVQPQVNINGVMYQLNLEVEVPNNSNTIFIIDGVTFLDGNPDKAQPVVTATAVVSTVVPVGATGSVPAQQPVPVPVPTAQQPVPVPVSVSTTAPEAPFTQAPVAPEQTAQPVVQASVQTQPQVQFVAASIPATTSTIDGEMNPPAPTVEASFDSTGVEAPF